MQQDMSDDSLVQCLARIRKRGSQGVCLKAQDRPRVRDAVDALIGQGIPVVTLATDVPATGRKAYVGLDNASAGRTAAYLIAMGLGQGEGTVLTTRSREQFLGEGDREAAFLKTLGKLRPHVKVHPVVGGAGLATETSKLVRRALTQIDGLCGIYSMGGGNGTIVDELEVRGLWPDVFVAHDLDVDNRKLIEVGKLNYVLHHDLRVDMTKVFQMFLHHHKMLTQDPETLLSRVQVITPENVPPLDLGDGG
jgi:LacI family transcriptional regulator